VWVPHDVRDRVVDFVRCWSAKTEISAGRFIHLLGVRASKFYDWRERYGRVNEHNGWVPRDFWLAPWEKRAIIAFHGEHLLEGYRRLTFMMLDADVVAVSPSSVWRVLQRADQMCYKLSHSPGTKTPSGQSAARPAQLGLRPVVAVPPTSRLAQWQMHRQLPCSHDLEFPIGLLCTALVSHGHSGSPFPKKSSHPGLYLSPG
jgi:hypothetical protein